MSVPTELYILRRIGKTDWDESRAFVVRAKSPGEARVLAGAQAGMEQERAWLNDNQTSCERLRDEGEVEVVLRDYKAG